MAFEKRWRAGQWLRSERVARVRETALQMQPGTGHSCPAPSAHGRCPSLRPRLLGPAGLVFASLALVLLVLAAGAAQAAETELLSATLEVKDLGSNSLGCGNAVAGSYCSTSSILSDDDFSFNGTDYTLRNIFLRSGQLNIDFDPSEALPSALTLEVDGTNFAVADAEHNSVGWIYWDSSGLSWSAGDSASINVKESVTAVSPVAVSSVAVTSTPTAASDTYGVGETIRFTVTFDSPVRVTGAPHFEFALGPSGSAVDKEAAYESGDGTNALVFAYTVLATDMDDNGIWIGDQTRTIMLDAGETIRDLDSNTLDAVLTHDGLGTQSSHTVDGSLTPPSIINNPATGAPTISGTATVGETLTVSTTGIMDIDGLTRATYTYQWIRVDEDGMSNSLDIGVTSSTYVLVATDEGKKYKVIVSFQDDLGNAEVLTSATYPSGTETVAPIVIPCGVLWCATLTVGTTTDVNSNTMYGYRTQSSGDFGSLSPATFVRDTATVGVTILAYNSAANGMLDFQITRSAGTVPADGLLGSATLVLTLGSETFSIPSPGNSQTLDFEFDPATLSWNDGDTVEVSLAIRPQTNVATDRAALVALYNATDGANWTNNTHWLSTRPLSDWYGVTTDADGRVTRVSLYFNALSGTIPAELGSLDRLQYLYLADNTLTGAIPAELGDLANLQELYLHTNALSGAIPVALGNLANLQKLHLNANALSGTIPVELGNLANLQELYLWGNALSGAIPSELGNLGSPQVPVPRAERVERRHPGGIGRLGQPPGVASQQQCVERGDPGGAGEPGQPPDPVSRRQYIDRRHPG